jgi:hypothetical protein
MQNKTANERTSLRELSLDEAEIVGGGFSWGGLLRGVEHFGHDVAEGMASGFVMGGVAGAIGGEGVGAAPGAVLGSLGGAVGGALYFLRLGPGF